MLNVIASFDYETKHYVISRNFQLNETGETTIQRVFSTFKSLFSSRVSSGIPLRINYASQKPKEFRRIKNFITWNYMLRVIAIFGNET